MRPALAIAAFAAIASALPQQLFAGGRSASMGVSATVQRSAIFRMTDSFQQLTASNLDFSKGYIDLPGSVQILVNSGSSARRVLNVTIEVEPNPELVRSIQMRARTEGTGDGARDQRARDDSTQDLSLGYRLLLTERGRAGDFTVPVTLTINL